MVLIPQEHLHLLILDHLNRVVRIQGQGMVLFLFKYHLIL